LLAVAIWCELGDCRRLSRSDQAVRHTGLDVAVDSSDLRRAGGYLSRQGPATLRWALFEAAHNASRPDHAYYSAVKDRHDGKLAAISVARQLTRRCCHTLRSLDPDIVYATPSAV
jgi:transposase